MVSGVCTFMVCGMTQRHIIVEGPDGSGKTGMVGRINSLGFTTHPRASTSTGGPIADISTYTIEDLSRLEADVAYGPHGPWVYDRHPLISELIYAPYCRNTLPQGRFADPGWVKFQRDRLARHVMIVWCLPPRSHVRGNVMRNGFEQMPGVVDNIDEIYRAYQLAPRVWDCPQMWWDYTYMDWAQFSNEIKDRLRTHEAEVDA